MYDGIWSVIWLATVPIAFCIVGFISAIGLSKRAVAIRVRKFSAAGLGLFFLIAPLFAPNVASYSNVSLDEKIETLPAVSTAEDLARNEKSRDRLIEGLRKEALRTREDLYRAAQYNFFMSHLFSLVLFTICVYLVSSKADRLLVVGESADTVEKYETIDNLET